jgi:hypothetical protein
MLVMSDGKVPSYHIPGKARDGGKNVELRTSNNEVNDHHHEDCAGFRASGLVKCLDDWVKCWCVGDLVEIAKRSQQLLTCFRAQNGKHTQDRKEAR